MNPDLERGGYASGCPSNRHSLVPGQRNLSGTPMNLSNPYGGIMPPGVTGGFIYLREGEGLLFT